MRVIIYGANGVMGNKIVEMINDDKSIEVIAKVDPLSDLYLTSLNGLKIKSDVLIDFSHPNNLEDILRFALENKTAVLLCTTGYTEADVLRIEETSRVVPIMRAGNTSVGIAVLKAIIKKTMEMIPSWDCEIIEAHHNRKVDSPSGTAKEIIKILQEDKEEAILSFGRNQSTGKRKSSEIGVHSVRGGSIVGDHTVIFAGYNEVIEIKHKAISRDLFASGAIQLAKYLEGKQPGLYEVADAY